MSKNIKAIFALIWLLGFVAVAAAAQVRERENVLVLHSYGPDFAWTRSQQEGIDAVFGPLAARYEVRTEYLDALRYPELPTSPLLLDLLRAKFLNQRIDVVLTSDNAAFNFARAHRAELFPGIPIVFMGVNGYEDAMLRGETGITGVAEDSDLAGTLRVLLRLLPGTQRIVFPGMTDDLTYRAIRATVAGELAALPPHVVAEFPEYPHVDALLDDLHTRPPDTAIIVMTNMRTRNGDGIGSQRVVELVSAAAPAPVFTNWDFVVGQGAVGGSVIGGVEHGRQAAEIALRILRGERPETIPVRRGAGKTLLFDHRQLARFDIPAARLPPEAVVLFSPDRSFKIPREAAWIAGVSFALLLGFAATLALAVRRRRRAEEQVRMLNRELERRVAERTDELRQQSRYLRTLVDTLPVSVWLKDTESRYLTVGANDTLSGRATGEMLGKSDIELWPGEIGASLRATDRKVMDSRQRLTLELALPDREGKLQWREIDQAPVIDEDGSVLGTVGVARDICARKAAEAAREAALAEAERLARVRRDFLAQMSHELRTPLNGILGNARALTRSAVGDERLAAGLATIRQCGEQLRTLIDDILDFAKIEAGKLEAVPASLPLRNFLRSVVDTVGLRAEEKGLRFVFDAAADLPATILADERMLRQTLLNLLTNAIKFTDRGEVRLRATLAGPGRLRFDVEDTGIGIEAHQIEAIFRPFEQVGEPRRRLDGTGLGLAIGREFVRRMGGEIRVDSRVGAGSRFWFELAALDVAPGDAAMAPAPAASGMRAPPAAASAAPLSVPPAAEMAQFHDLALRGNMSEIRRLALTLEARDPRYRRFAGHLRHLADGCLSKAMLAFVEQHMRDAAE